MKWKIDASCGNSPKNQMLIDWAQEFIASETDLPFITDESIITYFGETIALFDFEMPSDIHEMHIETAITHGRIGSLLGKAVSDSKDYPFALFFEFSLGKQPKIKSVKCVIES